MVGLSFQIDVKNIERFDALAAAVSPTELRTVLYYGLQRGMYIIHQNLPPYPPAPERSTYRRTGLLGRSITVETRATPEGAESEIGTNVPYGPYVIGDDTMQAWMHKGRWWQLPDQVFKNIESVTEEISQSIERRISRGGF